MLCLAIPHLSLQTAMLACYACQVDNLPGGRWQPFYHVLVHMEDRPHQTTCVAQCNIVGPGEMLLVLLREGEFFYYYCRVVMTVHSPPLTSMQRSMACQSQSSIPRQAPTLRGCYTERMAECAAMCPTLTWHSSTLMTVTMCTGRESRTGLAPGKPRTSRQSLAQLAAGIEPCIWLFCTALLSSCCLF